MAKRGRPTMFNEELMIRILSLLSSGHSMRSICKLDDMPSMETMWKWLREKPEFAEQYTRAKQESADAMAEDILDIADDGTNDTIIKVRKDGTEYEAADKDYIQRSRLRVETRKWLMSKMKPKRYGDKIDITSGGDKINKELSEKELDDIINRAERKESKVNKDRQNS